MPSNQLRWQGRRTSRFAGRDSGLTGVVSTATNQLCQQTDICMGDRAGRIVAVPDPLPDTLAIPSIVMGETALTVIQIRFVSGTVTARMDAGARLSMGSTLNRRGEFQTRHVFVGSCRGDSGTLILEPIMAASQARQIRLAKVYRCKPNTECWHSGRSTKNAIPRREGRDESRSLAERSSTTTAQANRQSEAFN